MAVAGLAALSATMVTVSMGSHREQAAELRRNQATYLCQAGLSQAMYQLQRGLDGAVGSMHDPSLWGGGQFWVGSSSGGTNITVLDATGADAGATVHQQLVVRGVPTNMWTRALFGKDSVSLDATVNVDSYDSTLGTYASQVSGGGNNAHARSNGSVGSNGNISASSATKIWGNANPGPGHTVSLHEASVTGSTTPATSPVVFPPLSVPSYTAKGALSATSNKTIPAGNWTYTNVSVSQNKTLTLTGPANIVISNLTMVSNSNISINDAAGPVTLTIIDNVKLDSNSNIIPISKNPANLRINMLSDNVADPEVVVALDSVSISSNTTIYGVIYAPEARIRLDSNFVLYGAIMARDLSFDSNCKFHFDENLLSAMASGATTYEVLAWRRISSHD
jgi:hypothetical protein